MNLQAESLVGGGRRSGGATTLAATIACASSVSSSNVDRNPLCIRKRQRTTINDLLVDLISVFCKCVFT
jgi:hypothetical protein